jgi:mono/diheme cytochrome c family protein
MLNRLLLLFSLATPLLAQDGQQLFSLYCSACHAADGKGAGQGAFPPLAGSPWVAGEPDRAVKILMHGLHGPIEVNGKAYNLEMPAQGAMLPDDQIAAILTFVRSAWGNASPAVTTEFVKQTRAGTKDRVEAWTSEELLKLHPLPFEKTALTNLISQTYKGTWTDLPNFSNLKAENVEEEHDGVISLADSSLTNDFAMVWEGDFEAPKDGNYTFELDADDGASLIIDGTVLAKVKGLGPMDGSRAKKGKTTLTKGLHKFRLEYFEAGDKHSITLSWKGPGMKVAKWLTDEKPANSLIVSEFIPLAPTGNRPIIYRNFIEGATSRAIGVGFPGELNLAYSAENLAPALIWKGKFMDAAAKWIERGSGKSSPEGTSVIKLSEASALPDTARFKGYKLDASGNPTFAVQIGSQVLLDSWSADSGKLIRKLSITGPPLEINIPKIEDLTVAGAGDKNAITLTSGQPITLTYTWE